MPNEALVPITPPPTDYDKLATAFSESLNLFSSMVPAALLHKVQQEIKSSKDMLESRKKTLDQNVQSTQVVLEVYHQRVLTDLALDLAVIESTYKVDINRELQRNDICYHNMEAPLRDLGFISKQTIEQNKYSFYGKSIIDLYFYNDSSGGSINLAVIKKLQDVSETETHGGGDYGIMAGLAEFKVGGQGNMRMHYSQMFADLIRIGSLLTVNALRRGKVIDKVVVYGLLVNYERRLGVIMKYYANLTGDKTIFFIGDEMDAVKGMVGIVRALKFEK